MREVSVKERPIIPGGKQKKGTKSQDHVFIANDDKSRKPLLELARLTSKESIRHADVVEALKDAPYLTKFVNQLIQIDNGECRLKPQSDHHLPFLKDLCRMTSVYGGLVKNPRLAALQTHLVPIALSQMRLMKSSPLSSAFSPMIQQLRNKEPLTLDMATFDCPSANTVCKAESSVSDKALV